MLFKPKKRAGWIKPALPLCFFYLVLLESVTSHFPDKVYETKIPRTVRLSEAPSHGMPITEYDTKSVGAEKYRALAEEVMRR